jgi:hypothetical protein
MTVKFDIHDYLNSHLETPRGRGGWMFALDLDEVDHGDYSNTISSPSMTYTDAKKWARKEITARMLATGHLLPREITLYVLA